MDHIVIIGFESAGITAASAARTTNRDVKITAVERQPYAIYHPCAIPSAIEGTIKDMGDLIEPAPKMPNVEVRTSTEATGINPDDQTVELKTDGGTEELEYDSLIISTGSNAIKPPITGRDLDGVHVLKTIEDGQAIINEIGKAENAVVVGGGCIGIEAAAALNERGLNVSIVEMLPSLLPGLLDSDMVKTVGERLEDMGIKVYRGTRVEEILGDDRVKSVSIGEEELPAELVILAVGVEPEVELAKNAGIEIGETGGIKTDQHTCTSIDEIYAAGDCAESFSPITNQPILSQFATTAIRMGKVAGTNAAGGSASYLGSLNTAVTWAYGLEIAATGVTTKAAEEAGFQPVSARTRVSSKPHYYPGAKPITTKITVEPEQHKIIGGQIIGTEGASERANLLALAIQKETTIEELAKSDYCYSPPINDCIGPLVVTAETLIRKLR
ncbi:hypothetical protein AKJ47_00420 [candidate division MSBL1 archaeon SCGC-AAA261G05]|uniref:Pyridine nucleotide-disulfide oxidoreductase n=2 Tax=candidate division MSBL1 TaxID=215777 RepID=A0A133VCH6_9EURY|nr:hypothetical protein AKJ47_00420 [candidate division MSBL1 archaeon SCGC-AAA261G05]